MPLSFYTDDTSQEEIERRRAERMARKEAKDKAKTSKSRRAAIVKAKHREKDFFPNLTGEFDADSPFAKHFTRKHD